MALKKIIGFFSLFVVSVSFAQQQHYSRWEKIKRGLGTARDVTYGAALRKTGIRFVTPAQVDAALEKPRDFDRFIRKYGKDVSVAKGVISRFEEGSEPLLKYALESRHPNAEALALRLIEKGAKPVQSYFDAYVTAIEQKRMPIIRALSAKNHPVSGKAFLAALNSDKEIKEYILERLKKTDAFINSAEYLEAAVIANDIGMVKFLLDRGASVDLADKRNGKTALHGASSIGNQDMINLLISRDANVHALTHEKETPLHFATNAAIAQILLQAKAEVDATDIHGLTPFFTHYGRGNKELNDVLLKAGASIKRTDRDGNSLLQRFLHNADVAIAILNTLPVNVNNKNRQGNTALHDAVRIGNQKLIDALLQKGAIINAANIKGTTPLMQAIAMGSKEIVRFLLDRGANISAIDASGNSALHYAFKSRPDLAMITILLDAGASVTAVNQAGRTPLHLTAKKGNYQIFILLTTGKAFDINLKDGDGNTVLHYAIPNENLVRYLIDRRAAPDITNGEQKTAFHLAVETPKKSEILRALMASPLSYDVDVKDARGDTPLYIATKNRDLDAAQLLVKKGANANKQNRLGDTPLHAAGSNSQMVGFLMQHGADPAIPNNRGIWPQKYEETREAIKRQKEEEARREQERQERMRPPAYSPESPTYVPPTPSAPPLELEKPYQPQPSAPPLEEPAQAYIPPEPSAPPLEKEELPRGDVPSREGDVVTPTLVLSADPEKAVEQIAKSFNLNLTSGPTAAADKLLLRYVAQQNTVGIRSVLRNQQVSPKALNAAKTIARNRNWSAVIEALNVKK